MDRRAFLEMIMGATALTVGGLPGMRSSAEAQTWTPPIGIPMPPIGVTERPRALPSPWTSNVTGFYYVRSGGSNSGNGFPSSPRGGLPSAPPPGSVVVIDQTAGIGGSFGSINGWAGTAASPIWIVSSSASVEAPFKYTEFYFRNTSYVVVDGLAVSLAGGGIGSFAFLSGSHHIAVKNSTFVGNPSGGGIGIGPGGEPASNIVLLNCKVTNSGDVDANFDQDRHGVVPGGSASDVWVLDCELARNSGDGMQIQGATRLYVGRCQIHHNRQNGVWIKWGRDVIVSQCASYGHRFHTPSGYSAGVGAGFGGQYDHEWDWWLFNRSYDNNNGFQVASEDNGIPNSKHFWIGNVVDGITSEDSAGTVPFSAAFHLWGGRNRYLVHNTCHACPSFVVIANPNTTDSFAHIENNIFWNRTDSGGSDLETDRTQVVANSKIQRNIFPAPPRFRWGTSPLTSVASFQNGTTRKDNFSVDPRFVDPAANDFGLQPSSPAIDGGALIDDVYQMFQDRYGRAIRVDFDAHARPVAGGYDIGAFEFGGSGPGPLPPAPTNLSVK